MLLYGLSQLMLGLFAADSVAWACIALRHNLCEWRHQLAGTNRWFNIIREIVRRVRPARPTSEHQKAERYEEKTLT